MPFLSHLAELRHRIVVIALTVSVAACVAYPFSPQVLAWVFSPITPFLPNHRVFIPGPFDAFMFRFKVSFYAAIVLTSPIWFYQVLAFFLPALKPKERRWFWPAFIAILALFLGGNLFCHYLVLGPSFKWLLDQANGGTDIVALFNSIFHTGAASSAPTLTLSVLPNAPTFLNGVMILMLAFGIIFELPVFLFVLLATGVLKYQKLRKNWRYSYLVLTLFATLSTPDWSPVTMGSLFVAVVILYESTLLLARLVLNKRIRQQALEAEAA